MPRGNSCLLFSVFQAVVKIPMCHSPGKAQWTSPEFLFIQSKTVGNVASTECHHLSGKVVNVELKLLVYVCSIIFERSGV